MRILVLILALLCATPVLAAPTCQDRDGGTIKCGVPGAMPVGWKPSPEHLWDRKLSRPPGPDSDQVLTAIFVLALLFSLIALMPKFDGSQSDDWEVPEKKEKEKE
jgi:hypothetical protein